MVDSLISIAVFDTADQASLAKSTLEDAGIKAVLDGENTVQWNWYLGNAVGGIKLVVADSDADSARGVLADRDQVAVLQPEAIPEEMSDECQGEPLLVAAAAEEPEQEPNEREKNAESAFRTAVVALLFFPMEIYAFWLIYKVFVADEPMRTKYACRAILAACINFPIMLCLAYFLNFEYWDIFW